MPNRSLGVNLKLVSFEGMAFGLMVGAGESYIPAFVLALGLGHAVSGLVVSWPLLAGAALQGLAPAGVARVGSLRRWSVLCALVQAAVFAPLVLIAWRGHTSVSLLFLITALYWGAGLSLTPAWNSWMGQTVPPRLRRRYFARRTSWVQMVVLAGLLCAGGLLYRMSNGSSTQPFVWLFALAGCARCVSAGILARQSEPQGPLHAGTPWGLADFVRFMRQHSDARILLYFVCAQFAVYIAAPYFTAFMLENLRVGYLEYTALLSASFVGKIVTLPLLARLGSGVTSRRLLPFGALALVPLPAFWLITDSFGLLVVAQLVAGALWAVYELTVILLQMEMAPAEHRGSVLASLNFFNAVAQVSGASLGAIMLGQLGSGDSTYTGVFLCSALARAACLPLLRGLPGSGVPIQSVALRVIAVRPSLGAVLRPVHATFRAGRRARVPNIERPAKVSRGRGREHHPAVHTPYP